MATYFKELIDKIECDPDIDEIGIIMGAPPPAIVLVEHKLGVSMGILKPMFVYAASEFSQLLLKLPSVTPGSEEHYALCRSGLDLSKAILLVKGDIGIAINFRKEMIVNGLLSCQEEIKFLRMLFTKHPKSPGGWQHRRFCLMQLLSERVPLIMELELELCRRMAELYPKNYYAWNHRLWLLPHMSLLQLDEELHFCKNWMYSHVSDHSAASHAVQVLRFFVGAAPRALTESEDAERSVNIIIGGLLTNQELICQRPGSEALWCQRRSIIGYLLQILRTIRGNLITAAAHSDLSVLKVIDWSFKITSIDCTYPVDDYVEVLSSDVKESLPSLHFNSVDSIHQDIESFLVQFIAAEYSFCCKCCNASDAWNYEAQKKYAHRYILFLLILVLKSPLSKKDNDIELSEEPCMRTLLKSGVFILTEIVKDEDAFPRLWIFLSDSV